MSSRRPRLSATALDLLHTIATTTLQPDQGWGYYLPDAPGVTRAKRRLQDLGYITPATTPGRPLHLTPTGHAALAHRRPNATCT